jgi:hypothetical protein
MLKKLLFIFIVSIAFVSVFNYGDTAKGFFLKKSYVTINNNNDLCTTIKSYLVDGKSEIYITIKNKSLKANKNAIPSAIEKVLTDYPDLNYLKGYVYSSEYIKFNYLFPQKNMIQMRNEADKKAKEIIKSIIKSGMSDIEKEIAIHDYIIKNTKYDYDNYLKNKIPDQSYTAYGILVNKIGVCQGYAIAMHKLLTMAGIETKYVTGTAKGSPHAWNIVKLNGDHYHLDTTLNDPVTFINGKRNEVIQYDYFNITDQQISKDHTWDKNKYPKCNSTNLNYKNIKSLNNNSSSSINDNIIKIISYDEFFTIVKTAIIKQEKTLKLQITNYNENKYNLSAVIKDIYKDNIINYSLSYKADLIVDDANKSAKMIINLEYKKE